MNREILFKAKTSFGEWIEGYFAVVGKRSVIIKAKPENYYCVDEKMRERHGNEIHDIDPVTICQYTGLTDKNGNKIWEKDICIIHSGDIDEEDGCFTVEWDDESARFVLYGEALAVDFDNLYGDECEVVGDMFDNPELLEQEG